MITAGTVEVIDVKTNERFRLQSGRDTEFVNTRDGQRVKIHPLVVATLVRRGTVFDGQTLRGPRRFKRL